MPRSSSKKRAAASGPFDASAEIFDNPLRPGLPSLDSVHSTKTVKPVAAGGRSFNVIRTREIDSYELGPDTAALSVPLTALAAAPAGDNFKGTARKAAKLSIADAPTERFRDVRSLIRTLPAHNAMRFHNPPIKTTATSNRVQEEKRNVRVKAFLYAASRENDNDFHIIIGRDPERAPEMYMTVEISGLPPQSSQFFDTLKEARDAYKNFFGNDLPGLSYDFYDPPIPVIIEGSLFFDMSHATGQRPGPQSLKSRMPVVWEVHPVTRIEFEP